MGGNEEVINVVEEVVMISDEKGSKYLLHCLTEGGRGVGESEIHDSWFVEAEWCFEHHLPPVLLLDADVVIPPSYVELGEVSLPLEMIQYVANEW